MIGKVIYSIISIIVLALVYPVPNIQEVNSCNILFNMGDKTRRLCQ